ncbi:MAG: phage holin family protein [Rhodopirellula sp.]|nr:phage holin family protein [Rhodopirellula sp.]
MADQTTLNNDQPQSPASGMRQSMTDFAADLAELTELQLHLFFADSQQIRKDIGVPIAAFAGGVVVALGCVPVALVTLALVLVAAAGLSPSAAFAIAFGTGMVAAIALLAFGWSKLRRSLSGFERSTFEARRNFQWLKKTLRQTS